MARPKKEENIKHENRVYVRYSDVEYDLLKTYAEETGCPVATYVRNTSLGNRPKIIYNVTADIEEIQKLTTEFGKIGNNLNQIAKFFHMGGARSQAMQDEINRCITELRELRREVIKMVGDYHGSFETYRK